MMFEIQRGLSCQEVQGSDLSEFHCESFKLVSKPCLAGARVAQLV